MDNLDVWQLIQMGQFEKAMEVADKEFEQSNNIFPLRNKVYALLHLKKYDEVILLTNTLIEMRNGETDSDFIFCGIGLWLLNKKEEAINKWQKALNSKYTDAAGGIELMTILYFASLRMENDHLKTHTLKRIKKLIASKKAINWPGPIGAYILGNISNDKLLSSVTTVPVLKERQLSQAYFALAIQELQERNIKNYIERLKDSVSFGPAAYLEQFFYLAKGELESMSDSKE